MSNPTPWSSFCPYLISYAALYADLHRLWASVATRKQIELLKKWLRSVPPTRTDYDSHCHTMFWKAILLQWQREWRENGYRHFARMTPMPWSTFYNWNHRTKLSFCRLRLTVDYLFIHWPKKLVKTCYTTQSSLYCARYFGVGSTHKSILHNLISVLATIDFLNACE